MRVFDLFSENNQNISITSRSDKKINPKDLVTMDIPLLLRIMEYAREDADTDMDLHNAADNMIRLSSTGQTLNMNHYNQIVSHNNLIKDQVEGDAPAEKLLKDIEYHPKDNEEVEEGYGRYWCSTDKRWKERQGPKQSRG